MTDTQNPPSSRPPGSLRAARRRRRDPPRRRHLRARPDPHPDRLRRPAPDGDQGARRVPRVRRHITIGDDHTASDRRGHHADRLDRHRHPGPRQAPAFRRLPRGREVPRPSPSRNARVVGQKGTDFTVVGDLTIKDVTREVTLDVELDGVGEGPVGQRASSPSPPRPRSTARTSASPGTSRSRPAASSSPRRSRIEIEAQAVPPGLIRPTRVPRRPGVLSAPGASRCPAVRDRGSPRTRW